MITSHTASAMSPKTATIAIIVGNTFALDSAATMLSFVAFFIASISARSLESSSFNASAFAL